MTFQKEVKHKKRLRTAGLDKGLDVFKIVQNKYYFFNIIAFVHWNKIKFKTYIYTVF